jgi:hypothetical protein
MRILQGQVMYRDFFAPCGPVVFWQSQFFRDGRHFLSMVMAGGVVNAIAVACVIWILRRLAPAPHRLTALAGGFDRVVVLGSVRNPVVRTDGLRFNLIASALCWKRVQGSRRRPPSARRRMFWLFPFSTSKARASSSRRYSGHRGSDGRA